MNLSPEQKQLLARYSAGDISAMDVRRIFGGITYGDLLIMLAQQNLSFPTTPVAGRETGLEQARAWLFPKQDRAA